MSFYVIGSINMDLVITSPKLPVSGETVIGSGFIQNPGGKGANQAVAIAKSGGIVSMVGCVGYSYGTELVDTLQSYQVDTTFVSWIKGSPSGVAVILITENDNRIILDQGANLHLTKTMIDNALSYATEKDYLILQLEIDLAIVEYAAKVARKKNMTIVLNPAPAKELPSSLFSYCDFLIPNQSETSFYTSIYPKTHDDIKKAGNYFQSLGVKNVLITLGEQGSVYCGEHLHFQDSYPVSVVDTTAAGDSYIGAFVVNHAITKSIPEAMNYASLAAACTVSKKGAQQAIPNKLEILSFHKEVLCKKKVSH